MAQVVTVECSANHCRFKNNSVYYGICKNPKLQEEYSMFASGSVQISGCPCQSCSSDCGIIPETLPVDI